MLFSNFAFQRAVECGKRLQIFAPTQREEEELAYDVACIGCKELYLQFKNVKDLIFMVDNRTSEDPPRRPQLDTLKTYPQNCVFYIAPRFQNTKSTSVMDKQRLQVDRNQGEAKVS
jgi:hypothetical protein